MSITASSSGSVPTTAATKRAPSIVRRTMAKQDSARLIPMGDSEAKGQESNNNTERSGNSPVNGMLVPKTRKPNELSPLNKKYAKATRISIRSTVEQQRAAQAATAVAAAAAAEKENNSMVKQKQMKSSSNTNNSSDVNNNDSDPFSSISSSSEENIEDFNDETTVQALQFDDNKKRRSSNNDRHHHQQQQRQQHIQKGDSVFTIGVGAKDEDLFPSKPQQHQQQDGGIPIVDDYSSDDDNFDGEKKHDATENNLNDGITEQQDEDADDDTIELAEFQGVLTTAKLQEITGYDDLHLVDFMEMKLDISTCPNVSVLGEEIPSLAKLRLSHSNIPTIRDLGTRFKNLRVLWLSNCGLKECAGLYMFSQLSELYLAFNGITSLADFSGLDQLSVLDLEGNSIACYNEVSWLQSLTKLSVLSLASNPFSLVAATSSDDKIKKKYRERILRIFLTNSDNKTTNSCQLASLDDVDVTPEEVETAAQHSDDDNQNNTAVDAETKLQDDDDKEHRQKQTDAKQTTTAAAPSKFLDPLAVDMSSELQDALRELECVTASIKANKDCGMGALIQEQHRSVYSRQATASSSAARRRPPTTTTAGSPSKVSSAPILDPAIYGGLEQTPPPAQKQRKVHSSDGVSPSRHQSALTSGSSGVFTGNITRHLRARRTGGGAGLPIAKGKNKKQGSKERSEEEGEEEEEEENDDDAEHDPQREDLDGFADDEKRSGDDGAADGCNDVHDDNDQDANGNDDNNNQQLGRFEAYLKDHAAELEEYTAKVRMSSKAVVDAVKSTKTHDCKLLEEDLMKEALCGPTTRATGTGESASSYSSHQHHQQQQGLEGYEALDATTFVPLDDF